MIIPKFSDFLSPFMECLADNQIHSLNEIRQYCVEAFGLSEKMLQIKLPSGQSVVYDRVGWARTYLKKAGLIDSPSRANFRITSDGQKAVANGVQNITVDYLCQFKSFQEFYHGKEKEHNKSEFIKENDTISPQEQIANAVEKMTNSLAEDLMTEVLKLSPFAFEDLVVKLLIKMGYGSSHLNTNAVTKKSGDEGIDGIIISDEFGFDAIYTQAKQWKADSTIGRPEVQKFLGALVGQGASKGLFITTAKFSKEAYTFAEKQLNCKIVLVDGSQLMKLMINYNLGVFVINTYDVKRIDMDFFTEEM